MKNNSQNLKADGGKSNPLLLEQGMPHALEAVNATLDYGAIKYEAHSWKQVPDAIKRYDAAMRRHRRERDKGDNFDAESFLHHLSHEIVCGLMVLQLIIEQTPGDYTAFNPNPPQDHKS
jgi:hypothetical protein